MSGKERDLGYLIRQTVGHRLSQREAAERLGISVRQFKRLIRSWKQDGDAGLLSRQRGRASHNRLAEEQRARITELLKDKYPDFGPTLAAEKLLELEGIKVSRETIRQLQVTLSLWKAKSRRVRRVFQLRDRRPRFGELIQIDGSPHDWFEGRAPRCTLIVFIDDATSRLTALRFVPAETTRGYLETLRGHVLEHGVPLAFYSDRHGIFRVNAKDAASGDGKTEFGRVSDRLGIEAIHALTPQAKGRVERANQTLQDRLVKELRLQGISSMEAANRYLPGFIGRWNAKFAVAPGDEASAHRPWTGTPNGGGFPWSCCSPPAGTRRQAPLPQPGVRPPNVSKRLAGRASVRCFFHCSRLQSNAWRPRWCVPRACSPLPTSRAGPCCSSLPANAPRWPPVPLRSPGKSSSVWC